MPVSNIHIFVDTTTTKTDVLLEKASWTQLLSLVARFEVHVVISEVVVRETVRHRDRQAAEAWGAFEAAAGKLLQRLKHLEALGAEVSWSPRPTSLPTADLKTGDRSEWRWRQRLTDLGVEILPLPSVSHDDVLSRDLQVRKPFQSNGKGYRDALIWESCKAFITDLPPGDHVFFVTANRSDYCEDDGSLHRDLAVELPSTSGASLEVASNLDALLTHRLVAPMVQRLATSKEYLREFLYSTEGQVDDHRIPSVEDLVRESVLSACDQMLGEEVRTSYDEDVAPGGLNFSEVEIPDEITDVTVAEVIVHQETFQWAIYDTYEGGTLLITAGVAADVALEGFIYKGDYYVLDREDVAVLEWDWNDHVAHVATTVSALLEFQLRVESGALMVDDVEFEAASPLRDALPEN